MARKMMAEGAILEAQKWEKMWSEYVKALKAHDAPVNRAHRRLTRARLVKAENTIRDYDPDFYSRIVAR